MSSVNSYEFRIGVALILKQDNKVLLHRRIVPGKLAFGEFAFPGGTVENNETIKQAACREAAEELGIQVSEQDTTVVHLLRLKNIQESNTKIHQIIILYYVEIKSWSGKIQNLEPEKHSDPFWFDINHLPHDLFIPNKEALSCIKKGVLFTEHGW